MYVGPVRYGEDIEAIIESRLTTLAPAEAEALPTFRVYDGTTEVYTGTAEAFDVAHLTAAYRIAFAASSANGLSRGKKYCIVAQWTVDPGASRMQHFWFNVT